MPQNYDSSKPTAGVTTFPQLWVIIKDHFAAVVSRFSGTSFPANPTTYQICWRSDRGTYGRAYCYTGDPNVGESGWVEDVLLTSIGVEIIAARGSKSSLDQRLDVTMNEDGTLKASTTLNPSEWFALSGHTFTYVSGTSFTVDGDQTDIYKPTRRIKANLTGGAVYSEVVSASYGAPNTTVVIKDAVLTNTLTTVEHSLFLPRVYSGAMSYEMTANKNVRTETDTTTSKINDSIILCNKASAMTVNLLSAVTFGAGRRLIVININIGAVTIDAAGTETISGALTYALNSQYQSAEIESDGTNWLLIGATIPFATAAEILTGTEAAKAIAPDQFVSSNVRKLLTAAGDLLYASAANTLARLAKATNGQVLTLTSGFPSWADIVLVDASVSQFKLKTSLGSVYANDALMTLPGGTYGFSPQSKDSAAGTLTGSFAVADTVGTTYITCVHLKNSQAGENYYMQQRYMAASGKDHWIFLLVDKATRKIIAAYEAPDHPSANSQVLHTELSNPFRSYDPARHDIVLADNEILNAIKGFLNRRRDILEIIHRSCIVDDAKSAEYDFRLIRKINEWPDELNPGHIKAEMIRVPQWAKIMIGPDVIALETFAVEKLPENIQYRHLNFDEKKLR